MSTWGGTNGAADLAELPDGSLSEYSGGPILDLPKTAWKRNRRCSTVAILVPVPFDPKESSRLLLGRDVLTQLNEPRGCGCAVSLIKLLKE